jgi:hypothetical protein
MRRIALGAVIVLVVAAAVVAWQADKAGFGAPAAGDEEAVAIIRAFTGKGDVAVRVLPNAPAQTVSRRLYRDTYGKGMYLVDFERREVVRATLDPDTAPGDGLPVTRDRALQIASDFAAPRVAGFEKLSLVDESPMDHGDAGTRYEFEWNVLLGSQQAQDLRPVSVEVDAATGAIFSFSQDPNSEATVDPEPTISREQALDIARRDVGDSKAVSQREPELRVWWRDSDRTKEQILMWVVEVKGDRAHSHRLYFIDAHTGEILTFGGYD